MKDELNPPSHSDFENFFINNIELNKIEAYLNRFNPIHIMKMENQEIRHSNILGWLLDPLNTHGLGDKFLKAFLTEALKGESLKGGLTSLQVNTFIEHYIDTLKEATGMSEHAKEMERIAKSLYRQHQKLIDFIWEHGSSNEFNLALDELLGENWEDKNKLTIKNIEITEFWSNGNLFCFLPLSWLKILKNCNSSWDGCENWWNTYPLICWIELRNGENTSGTL